MPLNARIQSCKLLHFQLITQGADITQDTQPDTAEYSNLESVLSESKKQ